MAQGSGLRNVIAALEQAGSKVRSHGGYYTAQCPAHDDRTASLSVSQGDKGAVFKCHTGCEKGDILAALNLPWTAIFDNGGQMDEADKQLAADLWMPCQRKGCGGHKSAEYRYTDEDGKLLYAVARCSRKGDGCPQPFAQWVPDENKKYGKAWGLPGSIRRVLYKLPQVIEAAEAGRRIFLMEGEKDADRMLADYPDEVATTIAAGAGKSKWKPEFGRYFKGASEVVIVADCDKTGLEYAEEVHHFLSAVVPKVRVMCSPLLNNGADFSDHRNYGLGLDDLEIVPFQPIEKRPEMIITIEDCDREKPVIFSGFSQEAVERSLVGSMLRHGHTYQITPIDIVTDPRLKVATQAAARLTAQGHVVTAETVAAEIEDMGVSTYAKALPELLKIEEVAFSDTEKPKVAARILRERTIRTHMTFWLSAVQRRLTNERVDLGAILEELGHAFHQHTEEYVHLDIYSQPVGDVFSGDVLEEIILEETEGQSEQEQKTNVRPIRPQVVLRMSGTAAGG